MVVSIKSNTHVKRSNVEQQVLVFEHLTALCSPLISVHADEDIKL